MRVRLAVHLLLGTLLLITGFPALGSAGFSDLAGHWAAGDVIAAVEAGLVNGYPDGRFRPEEPVTRAQFIKLMAQVEGLVPRPGSGGFSDSAGHWLAEQGYLQAAVDSGLVVPGDYGAVPALSPDQILTRLEAAVLAARATNRLGAALTLNRAPLSYGDAWLDWATGYLAAMNSAGVMKGKSLNRFGLRDELTRAEAAVIALRAQRARQAEEVPVWEANSWRVTTLGPNASRVAAAQDGTLWWLTGTSEVWRQAVGGEPALVTRLEGDWPGPIAAGSAGLYLARQHEVVLVGPDGRVERWAGATEPGYRNGGRAEARFATIYGLCTDPTGNLYVLEGPNEGRLRLINQEGQVSTAAGLSPRQELLIRYGEFYGDPVNLNEASTGPAYLARIQAEACAADGLGSVYLAGPEGSIDRLSPDGWVHRIAYGGGGGDGSLAEAGFRRVSSMAADPWGNLWLLDGFGRVRRITPDGHVYTAAGGGGEAVMIRWRDTEYPSWSPPQVSEDGIGPAARFAYPTSLALAGGRLYVTDQSGRLRVVTGHLDWYPGEQSVVLHPEADDTGFWAPADGGRYRPESVRLPVSLYAPAEAVGLKVDGRLEAEAHHPHYMMKWEAVTGSHTLTPMVRRPDGNWVEGAPRTVEVSEAGRSTARAALLQPRDGAWITGVIRLQAVSHWTEAELRVDGRTVARGTGLITAEMDSTTLADGRRQIRLVADGREVGAADVYVGNGGFPPREPDGDRFLLYAFGKRHYYNGPVVPRQGQNLPLVPFRETAEALGFQAIWDPESRLLTASDGRRTATIQVDTRETTGLSQPLVVGEVVAEGGEYLVDWLFFTLLLEGQSVFSETGQIMIIRR